MRTAFLFLALLIGGIFWAALAQVPQGTQLSGHPSLKFYRNTPQGQKLDFIITGDSAANINSHVMAINQFVLKSFKDGNPKVIQIIATAPHCLMDLTSHVASDPGPLQIYTPTTNLFVQGVGFQFAQDNHILIVSNEVETRIDKRLLKKSTLTGPRTNAEAGPVEFVTITSENARFNMDSNRIEYIEKAHVIDPQLDVESRQLTIQMTSNNAVEHILAQQNVLLTTTNNGRATGQTGYYYVTNNVEMMRLTTDADWHNGDQQASAREFEYDSGKHLLTALGHVIAHWPNPDRSQTNTLLAGTNGFRILYADFATLQFPPTNGPVEKMFARGNVIIVNQSDQSRALADQAIYDRMAGTFDLTGSPVWRTDQMEVSGDQLSAELNDKVYHARAGAHFKTRTGNDRSRVTNQWLLISSDDIDYHTNQAVFSRNVKTRLEENDHLRDKLNCDLLILNLTNNQVQSGSAIGNVSGETAPNLAGVFKTITCAQLNGWRNVKTGWMKSLDAHSNVVIREIGLKSVPRTNQLTAETVAATFSTVTNQIEKALAVDNVVLFQSKGLQTNSANSDRAVYTAANDQVKLTGHPIAHSGNYLITHADYLIWLPKTNQYQAFGVYKITPLKSVSRP